MNVNATGFLENIYRDGVYSLRSMRKNPAFAVTAALTLALGIGGNTAIFTVIRAVLLKPLEYRDPDRVVYFSVDKPQRNIQDANFSLTQFEEMKAAAKSFAALGAIGRPENVMLSGAGEPEALKGARVSANFLEILGVQPLIGRSFLPEEDVRGGRPVALISSALWKRRFGLDTAVAGRTATLDTTAYTIIGVLPHGFEFPYAGVDVWVTRPSEWSILPSRYWGLPTLSGFARLKPQVSLEQARAELSVLQHQYEVAHPDTMSSDLTATMRVVPLKDRLVSDVRTLLWTLFGAVGFVLLIACANVASLLLARATSRSREFAVRAALGASRARLIRQLLGESLVLSAAGGALGVLLASWGLSLITRGNALLISTKVNALYLPGAGEIRLDGLVLAFTLALSIATGVLFGLFPSLHISRPDLADVLRDHGAGSGRGSSTYARRLLVIGQVALSIILLIGAALLMQSFARLHNVDPGFQTANLLTAKIALPPARYDTDAKRAAFFGALLPRIDTLPGVRSAAMVMTLPTTAYIGTNISAVEGAPPIEEDDASANAGLQSVTPGFLRTLAIPLKRGREFTERDNTPGAPPVMMINESFARRFWPDYPRGETPIGRHIKEGYDKALGWIEVVGIVADIHQRSLANDAAPEFYIPTALHPPQLSYLAVRTNGDPLRLANSVRNAVLSVDSSQPISDVKTMEEVFEATLGQRRLTMLLIELFAGVALLLAVVGIYGVIAYSVAQRTQEVGIRQALGAQRSDILRLILRQGLGLAIAGVAIGIGGAFALTRVMKGFLFRVSATDPWTFAGISLLFILVALAASFIPARRAASIDPMEALRS